MSFASLLADSVEVPVVIVDADGAIHLANRRFELLVGRAREGLVSHPLVDLVVAEHRDRFALLLAGGMKGARRFGDIVMMTAGGIRVHVALEMSLVTGDGAAGLLCRVVESHVDTLSPRWPDAWVEIRIDDDFGKIIAAQAADDAANIGERCYRAIAGLPEPCVDCPAPRMAPQEHLADVQTLPDARVMIRKIYRSSASTAQVSHTVIAPENVARLLGSRLDVLAVRASLSEREREVLRQLVTGLSLEDIAEILHISTRTVRFHQANVLAKLGIDSRLELTRLVLDDESDPVDPAR